MTPGRILLLEPSGKRGLIHYAYCLAEALAESGERVCLATRAGHEIGPLGRAFDLIEAFPRHPLDLRPLPTLWRLLARDEGGVVHLQGAIHPELYLPLLWGVRRLTRATLVYTAHEVFPFKNRHLGNPIVGFAFRRLRVLQRLYGMVDAVIVHSQRDRDLLLRELAVPAAKVFVVPHGNYTFFTRLPGAFGEETRSRPEPTVLFFGVIVQSKGLSYLIRAFDRVRRAVPGARLVIAGQPYEDTRPYVALLRELHLTEVVRLELGYVPMGDIPRYFREADVVAVPYLEAAQSGVIHVAYAFSRPVVASACGGIPELVVHGKTGILVPPGDVAELSKALIDVLTDDELRRRMGSAARELVEREYPWSRVAEATVGVYHGRPSS